MRKSITLALTLTIALTATTPIYAARRQDPRNHETTITEVVKQIIRRILGITTNEEARPTIPIP